MGSRVAGQEVQDSKSAHLLRIPEMQAERPQCASAISCEPSGEQAASANEPVSTPIVAERVVDSQLDDSDDEPSAALKAVLLPMPPPTIHKKPQHPMLPPASVSGGRVFGSCIGRCIERQPSNDNLPNLDGRLSLRGDGSGQRDHESAARAGGLAYGTASPPPPCSPRAPFWSRSGPRSCGHS